MSKSEKRPARFNGGQSGRGKGVLRETLLDLKIAADALTRAAEELKAACDANETTWRESGLLIEPLARLGHAGRAIAVARRRFGANDDVTDVTDGEGVS